MRILCWIGLHRWASVFTFRDAPHVCSRCWDVMRVERGVYRSLKEDHVSQVIRKNARGTYGKRS